MNNYKLRKDGTPRVDRYKQNTKMVRLSNKNVEALDEFKHGIGSECKSRSEALEWLIEDYFRMKHISGS